MARSLEDHVILALGQLAFRAAVAEGRLEQAAEAVMQLQSAKADGSVTKEAGA